MVLARTGVDVTVFDAAATIGGGCRSEELTLPGYLHDHCSAIHPLAKASPFFKSLPLEAHGLSWVEPRVALAHPFDDGSAAILERSIPRTAASLGEDAEAYVRLLDPLVRDADYLVPHLLGPFRFPRHPITLARFGLVGLRSAEFLTRARFAGPKAKGLFAGLAAHSFLRLDQPTTAAFGLMLGLLGHTTGWPFPRGGSQAIVDALSSHLKSLGGMVQVDSPVESFDGFENGLIMLDVTPRQIAEIGRSQLPERYRRQLSRYRYGPGVFKVDWALDGPVPWTAEACHRAGTIHLGGTFEEIAAGERDVSLGRHSERPFVLIAQQSRFDRSRAPQGGETLWGYCHVPNGSTVDMTERIERQIERFAPGFRERIIGRAVAGPANFERYNANYVGGDINGGQQDIRQLFTRPLPRINPYATPDPRIFICSSSTPPGGGVHGMCGFHAATSALRRFS